ncbi:MAG: hypothetical protein V3V85_04165 [Candidatus Thorarchaeota archaeon]
MSLDVRIRDNNSRNTMRVNGEGEAHVVVHSHPPRDEEIASLPFRQFFTDDGTETGSIDMRVDGSTTNANFSINAINDFDLYIRTVSIAIADAGARLNLFGALAALTNGIMFTHNTSESGTLVLHDSIQTNLEFIRLGLANPPIGSGTAAFRADITGGGADAYLPTIDFSQIFGLPWGLRLRKSTTDTITFTVRDDLSTGIDQFDIIGYGIKI